MILVVFAIALLATIAVSLTDVVTDEAQSSGHAVSSDSAYQAAEAGIDTYASNLLDDQLYFLHYVAEGESTRVSGAVTADPGRTPGRAASPGPTRTARTTGACSGTAMPTTSRSPARAARPPRSSRRSRSSRPAAAGTATQNACGAAANNAQRTIQTLLVPSSVANFQMIANTAITYGATATTNGKIYSTGTVTTTAPRAGTSTRRSASSATRR